MVESQASLAQRERTDLCNLIEALGPDAPTLCEGWSTIDLAAHLVVRENRLDAGLGIIFKPAEAWTKKIQEKKKVDGLSKLIPTIRSGPPKLSPFGLLDDTINTIEYYVHHEDIRRAQKDWKPRELSADDQDALWKRLKMGAKLMTRKVPVGLTLKRPDGQTISVKQGDPQVILQGNPSEIILFLFGRKEQALVEFEGEKSAVEKLKHSQLGM